MTRLETLASALLVETIVVVAAPAKADDFVGQASVIDAIRSKSITRAFGSGASMRRESTQFCRGQDSLQYRTRPFGRAKRRSIKFCEHLTGDDPTVFENVCHMGLECIVSKRIDASSATREWSLSGLAPARPAQHPRPLYAD
ncbi:hypothetical protein BSZ19_10110 [Bradyrhizobium japonicum]|jgi:hypothetical protein|uniref:Uncharacterized protein n=1 Tax=Bradyrhizobium japonicum TaxID=375 RepID=A0A1Y2JVY1_BRAJP|nr:hypothetical protein BSZ19_10110 [Bradyrhizobium japonicum]